ncbi:MAG: radical SAM protein [Ruminococcus flavefaciens]|nr:radical SAM protein [Ruminococcus flavefaciens]
MERGLERIKVLITSACNSNCTHCFRRADKNTMQISWEKLKEIVDFGIENSCQLFSFSGGEFFTHPHAYDLIGYCLERNVNVSILTNALQIDIPFFKNITDKSKLSFQISIDGLKSKHDLRRGNGAFEQTMVNVKELYNLGYVLSAKTALDEINYIDITEILKMPWFSSFLILPVAFANNANHQQGVSADYKKLEQVIQIIYKNDALRKGVNYRCLCYPHELAIKYDGSVYPCTEAREHNEFMIGNITNKPLRKVIAEYELSPTQKFICPQSDVEVCKTCSQNAVCSHGCRLRALRFTGNFLGVDPFNCRVFKDDFSNIPIGQLFWGEK